MNNEISYRSVHMHLRVLYLNEFLDVWVLTGPNSPSPMFFVAVQETTGLKDRHGSFQLSTTADLTSMTLSAIADLALSVLSEALRSGKLPDWPANPSASPTSRDTSSPVPKESRS